jgi:putative proteasome-type protease
LLSAGNLATTQAVVSILDERAKARSIVCRRCLRRHQCSRRRGWLARRARSDRDDIACGPARRRFNASFILGGQIKGMEPRLFMIYPEGNFIEAGGDTPFFQIGETKYGRPIIVRAYDPEMSFAETAKLLMVSFDSTLKSNLSVGLPLDMLFYEKDSLDVTFQKRIAGDDPYYRTVSEGWSCLCLHRRAQAGQ